MGIAGGTNAKSNTTLKNPNPHEGLLVPFQTKETTLYLTKTLSCFLKNLFCILIKLIYFVIQRTNMKEITAKCFFQI